VLVLAHEPPTRTRLWESVGLSWPAVIPRSNSAHLSLENNSFTVRVSYFSDSRIALTFRPIWCDLTSARASWLYHDHRMGAWPHWLSCFSPRP
jgi:hypothetical protein